MTKPNTELGEEVVSVLHNAPPHLLMMSASVGIRTVRLAFPQGHQRKHGSHQRHYQAASWVKAINEGGMEGERQYGGDATWWAKSMWEPPPNDSQEPFWSKKGFMEAESLLWARKSEPLPLIQFHLSPLAVRPRGIHVTIFIVQYWKENKPAEYTSILWNFHLFWWTNKDLWMKDGCKTREVILL